MDTDDNPQSKPDQPNKVVDANSPGFEGIGQSVPTTPQTASPPKPDTPPAIDESSPPVPDLQPTTSSEHPDRPSFGDSKPATPAPDTTPPASYKPTTPPKIRTPRDRIIHSILAIVGLIIVAGLVAGAYTLGKHHEKIVIQAPAPQPINLPAQAVIINSCLPGRGKQYAIAKNLPTGPFYDVENSKVIAIEYNLTIDQLFTDSDTFSNDILNVTKNYSVNHFSILPSSTSSTSATPTGIHLIMFTVTKAVANKITCSSSTSSATSQG